MIGSSVVLIEPSFQQSILGEALGLRRNSFRVCLFMSVACALLLCSTQWGVQDLTTPDPPITTASLLSNPARFASRALHTFPRFSPPLASQPVMRGDRLTRRALADGNGGSEEFDSFRQELANKFNIEDFFDKDQALLDFEKGSKPNYFLQKYTHFWPPSATGKPSHGAKDPESELHQKLTNKNDETDRIKRLEKLYVQDYNNAQVSNNSCGGIKRGRGRWPRRPCDGDALPSDAAIPQSRREQIKRLEASFKLDSNPMDDKW